VTIGHEGRDLGGAKSQWVEREAEPAGKLEKKGVASRRMGRLSIPSPTERADRNEERNDGQERHTRNDEQERHTRNDDDSPPLTTMTPSLPLPSDPPFYRSGGAGWGR